MKIRHSKAINNFACALLFTGAIVFAGVAAGCRTVAVPAKNPPTRIVADGLGREVAVPAKVERVVSLAPSTTEMIFAAGAGNRLVGVTTYCNYPAEALAIPKVGDTQTPSIETIVAMKPQIVFVSTSSQLEAFTEMMRQQNIAVFVTNPVNFDGVISNLRQFGEIFGTERETEGRIAEFMERLEGIEKLTAGKPPVRVFVQISDNPLFTIGKRSYLTEIVERAGGVSVTKEVDSAYTIISRETAMALNPEAIILSESTDNSRPNSVFANSAATRAGRVYGISADLLSRPGPRLLDAMEMIARRLHGNENQPAN